MRHRLFVLAGMSSLALVAACGGSSGGSTAASSSTPSASSSSSSAPAAAATQIKLGSTSKGSVLTDDKGRVLYMFNPDNQGASVCYGGCAKAWPPTITTGAPTAGTGVDASLLGTTTRKDGSTQVTYNKYPLYTFAFDQKPGDTNGQAVESIWWVLDAKGVAQEAPAKVAVGSNSLGKVLTDVRGATLYMFANDKNGTSSCTGACLATWGPLHTFGAPTTGTGAKAALLGTTKRSDGVTQVTYNKHPLYFFLGDQAPGQAKGQGFKNLWFAVNGAGAIIKKTAG
jgi:predicted lipoprotein with Yx(FWY)xxD motif